MDTQSPVRPANLVATFIRHPNAANLLMTLLVLFGLFALLKINTQFFPTVDQPTVTIVTAWSGASAEDVESNVLSIIEPEVRFINGVKDMRSYAREGSGTVALEFEERTDMQKALSDVETAVKAVTNLPEDAEAPVISRSQFFDRVAKVALTGTVPEETLRIWAKRMRDDLVARGIDKIEFNGMRDREIQVVLPERELRRLDTSVTAVSNAIAQNSRDLPSGNIEGETDKQVRTLSDFRSVRAIGQVEVKSFASGEKVYLEDIADVRAGFDGDDLSGLSSGRTAIEMTVLRSPTADTLKTAAILETYLKEIRPQVPAGVEVLTYEVSSDLLSERIGLLVRNGVSGLVLVVAILFLFLNARIAFWVAAGIPIAMLATIGIMFVTGQTINMMSLFGLIMMLGVIVDDAIVVGEHTDTRLKMGDTPEMAAENGVGMMLVPVMAAMTTTAASFAPILLISGVIGQIMAVLPLVVLAVITASLVECFFILPGHLAHSLDAGARGRSRWSPWRQMFLALAAGLFLLLSSSPSASQMLGFGFGALAELISHWRSTLPAPLFALVIAAISYVFATLVEWLLSLLARRNAASGAKGESGFRRAFDKGFDWFKDKPFNGLVRMSYGWRYVTLAISVSLVLVIALGLLRSNRVEFVFFPSPEAENIRGFVTMNPGTPRERAVDAIARVEEALRSAERVLGKGEILVSAVFVTLGQAGRNTADNLAEVRVQLTSSETRTVRTPDIVKEWQARVPDIAGMNRFAIVEVRGGPPGRDIDIQIEGGSATKLKAAALDAAEILNGIAGVSGVADDLPFGKPELVMEITPLGRALGFSVEDVGRQVRNAFEGAIPRRFADGDDEVTIRVSQELRNKGMTGLRGLELKSPSGDFVPLVEVVKLTERQGFAVISRRDGKSILSVAGDIDNKINTTDGAIGQLRADGKLEAAMARHGVTYKFSGRAEEQKEAFADLLLGTAVALSVIYIILAWVFGSYWRPLAVMLIIPFGIVGAVFGHWVMGYQMTALSLIGLLGLGGILVNDSIILVSRMDERLAEGDDLSTAAIGASRDRLRAVILTSMTTIGGLLPLMYEKSLQAQFLLPMAITVVFGLALATLLVLFLVPALVGIGDDIRRALTAIFSGERTRRRLAT